MTDAAKTMWVDLGKPGFEVVLAGFEASPGEHAVVIRGAVALSSAEAAVLARAGFLRMTGPLTVWARPGSVFKMREIRAAFPKMSAKEMNASATRTLVRGPSPFSPGLPAGDAPEEQGAVGAVRIHADAVNAYQAVYRPGSKLGAPVAMIPVNMAEATARALAAIEKSRGSIDDFVARRLDLTTYEMAKILSPEQIDAVAMGVDAMERGRDFILADQTGLGKGRVLAALALAAAVAGKRIIFITEKANLFSDFWRDVMDTGADRKLGKPFLLNNESRIIDVTSLNGDVLFEADRNDVIRRHVRSGKMPDGHRLMMTTYSQFNRAGSQKGAFLASVAEDAFVISDEAHNASGDSTTAKTLDAALGAAWGTIRSSATFARRAASLLSYKKVLPPSLRGEDSAAILEAGGNALAEALSQYLAEDGVLVRREHDLSGLSIAVLVDDSRKVRNRNYADALAPVLARMAKLSRLVDDEVELRNEENEQAGGKGSREKWYTANFGSRLSPVIRQFVTALTVDMCVDRAIETLMAGEKPVIVIESTMESLMRELAGESSLDGAEDASEIPDDALPAEGTRPPDFKAALGMVLDRIMQMSVKRGKDDPEKIAVEDPFCMAEADAIRRLIDAFPDLSLSPIDDIRDRVEAEGRRLHAEGLLDRPWRADEISARKMRVREGLYEQMKAVDRNETIVAFNSGPIDALVITRAASTGLSLHASEKVADRRRRRMIELQIPANVVERVQFWGRVNRRGQVSVPGFETLCTGLPLQMRIMAMENRKVAALSANVSANAENASAMDVPDVIDSVGNEVAQRILEDQPKLAERMCVAMRVDPETAEQELYFVNKLLQRLCLLSSDEQDRVFAQLVTDYDDAIAGMKAKGRAPRGIREMEGTWTETGREPYEAGDPADGPVFGRAVDLVTMEGKVEKDPMTSEKVRFLIEQSRKRLGDACANAAGPFFENETRLVKSSRRKVLNASLAGRFISVDSALATPGPNAVKSADARLTGLMEAVRTAQPGLTMTVPGEDNEQMVAVIVDVRAPETDELHLPGRWSIRFAVPGEAHPKEISIATLLRDPVYEVHRLRPGGMPEPDLARFDAAPRGLVRETRLFLDGNLVKAVAVAAEAQAGSMVAYRGPDGVRKRSVLVNRRGRKALFDRSRKAKDATEAVDVLRSGRVLYTRPSDRAAGLVFRQDGKGFAADIPTGKDGKPFEAAVLASCGPFRPVRDFKSARIPQERIEEAVEAVLTAGHGLHYDPPNGPPPSVPKPAPKGFGGQRRGFTPRR